MANHRMFSNRIANSAKFLQMPAECQLLYFHMVLRADDDGVIECYPLIKMLGTPPDVIKVLLAKGYVRELNEDQVMVITDWTEHNKIRADRKVNSIHIDLLKNKAPDLKLIEPKPRSDVLDNSSRVGGQSTDGISKDKLSQVKLSKVNLVSKDTKAKASDEKTTFGNTHINLIMDSFKEIYGFPPTDKVPRQTAHNIVQKLQTYIKKNGKDPLEKIETYGDRTSKAITFFFRWVEKQQSLEKVKGLDILKRNIEVWISGVQV